MRSADAGFKRAAASSGSVREGEATGVKESSGRRTGSVTYEGDTATIAFERRLRHPIDRVWRALTEPEHLARWYLTAALIEGRAGGSIDYVSGPSRLHVTGKILAWDPPHLFEHEWNLEALPGHSQGERSVVRWELTPDGDGTILRVSHRRLTRGTASGFVSGVHAFLDRLEEELDGKPLTDWTARVGEVRGLYPPPEWAPPR